MSDWGSATVVWLIFAAYIIALLTTVVGQHNTTGWHHAIVRFHIFEALLVVVGVLQWLVLSRTDEALHLVAQTAERMRVLTEATERAWLHPSGAHGPSFEVGRPIQITVEYENTGRLLASFILAVHGAFYTATQWNDGTAAAVSNTYERQCINGLQSIARSASGVAYPSTGPAAPYRMDYDSNGPLIPENDRTLITQDQLSQIYMVHGCFVYHTGDAPDHHTSFCFYRLQQSLTPPSNGALSYCLFGQHAD